MIHFILTSAVSELRSSINSLTSVSEIDSKEGYCLPLSVLCVVDFTIMIIDCKVCQQQTLWGRIHGILCKRIKDFFYRKASCQYFASQKEK